MERDATLQLLRDNLVKAQDKMKMIVEKGRTERQFLVGDMIYLRLQPYRQISVGGCRPQKLSPLFFGSYKALQKVGTIAYKLELPTDTKIHPVFHVFELKKKLGTTSQLQHQTPHETIEQILEPELILDRRMVNKNNKTIVEILVKWKHLPNEEASWEE